MLENTFIHLPDYGPRRERRLWTSGILSWDDFLERFGSSPYHKNVSSRIASSKAALTCSDAYFFSQHLPRDEMSRVPPFREGSVRGHRDDRAFPADGLCDGGRIIRRQGREILRLRQEPPGIQARAREI